MDEKRCARQFLLFLAHNCTHVFRKHFQLFCKIKYSHSLQAATSPLVKLLTSNNANCYGIDADQITY